MPQLTLRAGEPFDGLVDAVHGQLSCGKVHMPDEQPFLTCCGGRGLGGGGGLGHRGTVLAEPVTGIAHPATVTVAPQ